VNVLDRVGLQTVFLCARGLKRVWILTLAGWLTSCSSSTPPPTTSAPPESFSELKQRISLIRELPFKREVSLATESPNATRTPPERIFSDEYGAQSLVHISHAYKRLGLLPESTDFPAALADYVRLDRIFYYDARRDLIVISPDTTPLVQAMTTAEPALNLEQLPVVLALSRALQEQHFQWQGKLNGISLEDRRLAFRALAVGDTVLVGTAYLQGSQRTTRLPDSARNLAGWATALEKMGSHLPQLLQQKLVFPYREGSQFVQWAHAAKGWTGVNALFADPPLSTSQILHPPKYYVKRENPLAIHASGLARQMMESATVDQTLGEYLVQLLLTSNLTRQEARQIAAGWTGDQLSAYLEGENLLTAWITAWKKDEDARAFYRAYQNLLQRLHRLRFAASPGRTDSMQAELPRDRLMMLQLVGSFVLLLDGTTPFRSMQLADEVWKSLDAETESTVILFDSAKGPTQLFLRSR
jgi:hypothetical protein